VARESLGFAVHELDATNEQLRFTNDELTSSNQELQSVNEELQSVNEALYIVNSEYQRKLVELEEIQGELECLLHVVDVGVLYLDDCLTLRRFNQTATRLLPLCSHNIGRLLQEMALQGDGRASMNAWPRCCARAFVTHALRSVTTALGGRSRCDPSGEPRRRG
jgi:two-component system, chemotaxis family, CheB/CheR fusion protein